MILFLFPGQGLARPNLRFYHESGWVDRPGVEGKRRLDAWAKGLEDKGSRLVVIEIGAGDTDPRIQVRPTGERLAKEQKRECLINVFIVLAVCKSYII